MLGQVASKIDGTDATVSPSGLQVRIDDWWVKVSSWLHQFWVVDLEDPCENNKKGSLFFSYLRCFIGGSMINKGDDEVDGVPSWEYVWTSRGEWQNLEKIAISGGGAVHPQNGLRKTWFGIYDCKSASNKTPIWSGHLHYLSLALSLAGLHPFVSSAFIVYVKVCWFLLVQSGPLGHPQ